MSALAGAAALLATEVLFTLRRDYFYEAPFPPLRGVTFGEAGAPRLNFVVIGDSTSVGVGASKPEETFPWLLAERLAGQFRVCLDVVGFSGARMADAAGIQTPEAVALDPDLVLVGIGGNDATHLTSISRVRAELARMLDDLGRTGASVVVVGPGEMRGVLAIPQPLRTLTVWSARRVGRVIREETRRRRLPLVDLAGLTGEAFRRAPHRYYSKDLFHPGAEGYALWADAMAPTVLAAAEDPHPPSPGPPHPATHRSK